MRLKGVPVPPFYWTGNPKPFRSEVGCSIQLRYGCRRIAECGMRISERRRTSCIEDATISLRIPNSAFGSAPEGSRTPNPQLRRLMLYPIELQAQLNLKMLLQVFLIPTRNVSGSSKWQLLTAIRSQAILGAIGAIYLLAHQYSQKIHPLQSETSLGCRGDFPLPPCVVGIFQVVDLDSRLLCLRMISQGEDCREIFLRFDGNS